MLVVHTGVGRNRCRVQIEEFLTNSHPKMLISSGFAGAVNDELEIGSLIIGRDLSDPRLVSLASQTLGKTVQIANLTTIDSVADSGDQRKAMARSNADAVDMETEIIAEACHSRGIPIISLRAISDSVAQPLPLPPSILFDLTKQRTNLIKLSGYLVTHPVAIARLLRFSREIRRARNNLATALLQVIDAFAVTDF